MKQLYTLLFCLMLVFACERKSNNDKTTKDNLSPQVTSYMDTVQNGSFSQKERAEAANRAIAILESSRDTKDTRKAYSTIAKYLLQFKKEKQARAILNEVLESSQADHDSLNAARVYNVLGNYNLDFGVNDSAYYYFIKAEKLFANTKDSLEIGKNYIEKAFAQLYESDYSGCELSCIQSLNFLRNTNQVQNEYHAFTLIGISSNELKNYDNALVYHRKALAYVDRFDQIKNAKIPYKSSTLNNLGYVYQNLGQHGNAINSFTQALRENNLLNRSPLIYATALDNLAYSKFKTNDSNQLPKLFYDALRIRETNDLFSGVVVSKIHLSEYYFNKGDTIRAQTMAQDAMVLAKNKKVSGDLLAALEQLSTVDAKNASKYSQEYIQIRDSIQNEERKAKDRFARIAFETDEIISQKDKLAEQNRNLLYIFGAVLVVGLLLFIIRNQRARNRELLLVQAQQKANEEIYTLMISQQANIEDSRIREKRRIAQELHDGILGRLFGARLNLDSLNRSLDEDSIQSRFNYLNELKNIEQDIREISHDLNREKYALINNFVAILNNLLEEQQNSHNTEVSVQIDGKIDWDNVANNVKIDLYRITQEALQNINKYAAAKRIEFALKEDVEGALTMIIKDDGIGFETSLKRKGIGLQNMEARVYDCKGKIDIISNKGIGTTISVYLPISKI